MNNFLYKFRLNRVVLLTLDIILIELVVRTFPPRTVVARRNRLGIRKQQGIRTSFLHCIPVSAID